MAWLTKAADVDGDVHVAVLGAVVHGLPQRPQLGFPNAQGARALLLGCSLRALDLALTLAGLWALGQDFLQGQHVTLVLVRLRQQLPEYIPRKPKGAKKYLRLWLLSKMDEETSNQSPTDKQHECMRQQKKSTTKHLMNIQWAKEVGGQVWSWNKHKQHRWLREAFMLNLAKQPMLSADTVAYCHANPSDHQ